MEKTYLNATYPERERVKALGARWDGAAKRWYVPDGLDTSAFAQWLPGTAVMSHSAGLLAQATKADESAASQERGVANTTGTLVQETKGVPLSQLLGDIRQTIEFAYKHGVWAQVEVIKVDVRRGHVYLELTERNTQGQAIATARGMIWAAVANTLMPAFETATGMVLGPGMKLLVRAKPSFSPLYGLSLEISSIDPSYTLGDLEAKKREIVAQLTREGLFELNRVLPAPWDFSQVLVIAPEQAAGLGDFQAESQRLQAFGVCTFTFEHAVFQGEAAPAQIQRALGRGLETGKAFDAVVIIRGGGAVNDLAWLNDYEIARAICECPVPVFTGIGHERDSTVLDLVAHTSYDTPSKVILGIENQIRHLWMQAKANFAYTHQTASKACAAESLRANKLHEGVRTHAVASIAAGRRNAQLQFESVRQGATQAVTGARTQSQQAFGQIQAHAQATVATAKERAPALFTRVLDQVGTKAQTAREKAHVSIGEVTHGAGRILRLARDQSDALLREVVGQGPEKTLRRGFAIVSDGRTSQPIKTASGLAAGSEVSIQMHDGAARAVITK